MALQVGRGDVSSIYRKNNWLPNHIWTPRLRLFWIWIFISPPFIWNSWFYLSTLITWHTPRMVGDSLIVHFCDFCSTSCFLFNRFCRVIRSAINGITICVITGRVEALNCMRWLIILWTINKISEINVFGHVEIFWLLWPTRSFRFPNLGFCGLLGPLFFSSHVLTSFFS